MFKAASPGDAIVSEVRVREGQLVDEGQILLRLDERDFLPTLEQARAEVEELEEQILDQATAARTMDELRAEISTLRHIESLAQQIRRSGEDTKWRELASLVSEIFTTASIANRAAEPAAGYRVDGGRFEGSGFSPEQQVPYPEDLSSRTDPQYEAAVNALMGII